MKRKHFTRPANLTQFGQWLYNELFTRNITIREVATAMGVTPAVLVWWMQGNRPININRLLQICAVLAPTIHDYHKLVQQAVFEMPNYFQIYYTQKQQHRGE